MLSVANTAVLSAQNTLSKVQNNESTSLERLASGLRINSAKDDAAGLQISSRLTSKINGSQQAIRNTLDGISVTQSVDGALESVIDNLQRMRTLTIAAGNGANTAIDIEAISEEFSALRDEIDRVANDTTFGGANLLNGTYVADFQVGQDALETIRVTDLNTKTENLGSYQWEPRGMEVISTYPSGLIRSSVRGVNLETAFNSGPLEVNGQSFNGPYTDIDDLIDDINSAPRLPNQSPLVAQKSGTIGVMGHFNYNMLPHVFQVNGIDVRCDDIPAYDPTITYPPNSLRNTEGGYYYVEITDRISTALAGQGVRLSGVIPDTQGDGSIRFSTSADTLELRNMSPLFSETEDGLYTPLIEFNSFGDKFTTMESELEDNAAFHLYSEDRIKATVDTLSLDTEEDRERSLEIIDIAIQQVSNQRNTMGATQNRFESTIRRQQTANTNLSAAKQRIQDADFAKETATLTQTQIIKQASTSILSQANVRAEGVLGLLDSI